MRSGGGEEKFSTGGREYGRSNIFSFFSPLSLFVVIVISSNRFLFLHLYLGVSISLPPFLVYEFLCILYLSRCLCVYLSISLTVIYPPLSVCYCWMINHYHPSACLSIRLFFVLLAYFFFYSRFRLRNPLAYLPPCIRDHYTFFIVSEYFNSHKIEYMHIAFMYIHVHA